MLANLFDKFGLRRKTRFETEEDSELRRGLLSLCVDVALLKVLRATMQIALDEKDVVFLIMVSSRRAQVCLTTQAHLMVCFSGVSQEQAVHLLHVHSGGRDWLAG